MTPPTLDIAFERFAETGEAADFARVFDASARDIRRVARRLAPDAASADDLVQETYLAAFESASAWDPSRPVGPWLLGIQINRARTARRRRRPAAAVDADAVERDQRVARPAVEPGSALAQEELDATVRAALGKLPEAERQAVAARLFDDLAPSELARRYGIEASTVRVRLHRGLEKLRRSVGSGFAGVSLGAPLGMRTLRAKVLAAAGGGAATPAAGGWAAPALLAVGLVAFGAVAWSVLRDSSGEPMAEALDEPSRTASAARSDGPVPDMPATTRTAVDTAPVEPPTEDGRDSVRRVRVRVEDEADGSPLEGIVVECARRVDDEWRGPQDTTDTDGSVTLDVPDGARRVRILALATGGTTSAQEYVNNFSSVEEEPVVLRVGRGGTITGTVVDRLGEPLPGADLPVEPLAQYKSVRLRYDDEGVPHALQDEVSLGVGSRPAIGLAGRGLPAPAE
ncbi:MAG: sigma-70 family RNA polymerase sigma factor, partial [Planctomycetota bacterium]